MQIQTNFSLKNYNTFGIEAKAKAFVSVESLENLKTVLKENEDTQWAQDIKAAYESQEFEDYILSQETYDGFIFPEAWENN